MAGEMSKLTYEEAIAKAKSGWWKKATAQEIVEFQLYEDRLCMDLSDYHEAVEKVLGRPVWTHEFAQPQRLRDEYEGKCKAPTMEHIIGQSPSEKVIVVEVDHGR